VRDRERAKAYSCSRWPPIPSGWSTLWLGPATNPSSDIEIAKRSLDTSYLPRNSVPARLATCGEVHDLAITPSRSGRLMASRFAELPVGEPPGQPTLVSRHLNAWLAGWAPSNCWTARWGWIVTSARFPDHPVLCRTTERTLGCCCLDRRNRPKCLRP